MARQMGPVYLRWLGTAAVLISDENTGILIDPYVSRFGIFKVAMGLPLQPDLEAVARCVACLEGINIQAVVVSHSHFDHCLDAPYFARETGSLLIGSESAVNVGKGAGLEDRYLRTVSPKQVIQIGHFSLRWIESAHGPAFLGRVPFPGVIDRPLIPPRPARDYKLGKTFSIMITHPAGAIVHHGSAGFIEGMYEGMKADVVLLGIAGRSNSGEYLQNVPLQLEAKRVIPIHFDNFFTPLEKKMKYLPGVKVNEFLTAADRYRNHFKIKMIAMNEKSAILPV